MLDVYMLPAEEGDCLWIRYGEENEKKKNILIDGGVKENGSQIAARIRQIAQWDEKLDAIFLTHIDGDHILGLIEGLDQVEAEVLQKCVGKIYFNTSIGIKREMNYPDETDEGFEDFFKKKKQRKKGTGYAVSDAYSLMDVIREKGITDRLVDFVTWDYEIPDLPEIRIISPGPDQIKDLFYKWRTDKFVKKKGYSVSDKQELSKTEKFMTTDLTDLMQEKCPGDDGSVANLSSIAFLFEYKNMKLAFLGDAGPRVCVEGLKRLYAKQCIEGDKNTGSTAGDEVVFDADLIKISHHGSYRNINDDFCNVFRSSYYMISSNGRTLTKQYTVPSKLAIARLLKREEPIVLLCNHDWQKKLEEHYNCEYFTANDKNLFLIKETLRIEQLTDQPYRIDEEKELNVYGGFGHEDQLPAADSENC